MEELLELCSVTLLHLSLLRSAQLRICYLPYVPNRQEVCFGLIVLPSFFVRKTKGEKFYRSLQTAKLCMRVASYNLLYVPTGHTFAVAWYDFYASSHLPLMGITYYSAFLQPGRRPSAVK